MDGADPTELIRHADSALAGVGKLHAEIADRIRARTDEVVTQTLKSAPLRTYARISRAAPGSAGWRTPTTARSPPSTRYRPGC